MANRRNAIRAEGNPAQKNDETKENFIEEIDKFKNSHERRKLVEEELTLKLGFFEHFKFWLPDWLYFSTKFNLYKRVKQSINDREER